MGTAGTAFDVKLVSLPPAGDFSPLVVSGENYTIVPTELRGVNTFSALGVLFVFTRYLMSSRRFLFLSSILFLASWLGGDCIGYGPMATFRLLWFVSGWILAIGVRFLGFSIPSPGVPIFGLCQIGSGISFTGSSWLLAQFVLLLALRLVSLRFPVSEVALLRARHWAICVLHLLDGSSAVYMPDVLVKLADHPDAANAAARGYDVGENRVVFASEPGDCICDADFVVLVAGSLQRPGRYDGTTITYSGGKMVIDSDRLGKRTVSCVPALGSTVYVTRGMWAYRFSVIKVSQFPILVPCGRILRPWVSLLSLPVLTTVDPRIDSTGSIARAIAPEIGFVPVVCAFYQAPSNGDTASDTGQYVVFYEGDATSMVVDAGMIAGFVPLLVLNTSQIAASAGANFSRGESSLLARNALVMALAAKVKAGMVYRSAANTSPPTVGSVSDEVYRLSAAGVVDLTRVNVTNFMGPFVVDQYGRATKPMMVLGRGADEDTIRRRVIDVRSDVITTPTMFMYMSEFVVSLVEKIRMSGVTRIVPLTNQEAEDRLSSRPSQRAKTEKVQSFWWGFWGHVTFRAFAKTEPFDADSAARNITTVDPVSQLHACRYIAPALAALCGIPNVGIGVDSNGMIGKLNAAIPPGAGILGTDYSKFDGRHCFMSHVLWLSVLIVLYGWTHAVSLCCVVCAMLFAGSKTKTGVEYNIGTSMTSGHYIVTFGNCLVNLFIGFVAARESGCTISEAWQHVGVVVGDDGAVPRFGPVNGKTGSVTLESRQAVAAQFGHKLTEEAVFVSGSGKEESITFLFVGRAFIYRYSSGFDNVSSPDAVRLLSKLHQVALDGRELLVAAREKLAGLLVENANDELVGELLVTLAGQLGSGVVQRDWRERLFGYTTSRVTGSVPAENVLGLMRVAYGVDDSAFMASLAAWKNQNFGIHRFPFGPIVLTCPEYAPDLGSAFQQAPVLVEPAVDPLLGVSSHERFSFRASVAAAAFGVAGRAISYRAGERSDLLFDPCEEFFGVSVGHGVLDFDTMVDRDYRPAAQFLCLLSRLDNGRAGFPTVRAAVRDVFGVDMSDVGHASVFMDGVGAFDTVSSGAGLIEVVVWSVDSAIVQEPCATEAVSDTGVAIVAPAVLLCDCCGAAHHTLTCPLFKQVQVEVPHAFSAWYLCSDWPGDGLITAKREKRIFFDVRADARRKLRQAVLALSGGDSRPYVTGVLKESRVWRATDGFPLTF